MLAAAAVCPHPPLLVPAMTGGGWRGTPHGLDGAAEAARELGRLRAACDAAVAAVLARRPDVVVVVGGAERSAEYPGSARSGLAAFGLPRGAPGGDALHGDAPGGDGPTWEVPGGDALGGDEPVLPLSLTIGRWLLGRGGGAPEIVLHSVAWSAPAAQCMALGADLARRARRVALLVMGDGTGRRARGVPGARDPEAERYDAEVATALAGADPARLAALDPEASADLFAAGRAAWQVLAGAVEAGGAGFHGDLRYAATPFEVTYFVATWLPSARQALASEATDAR